MSSLTIVLLDVMCISAVDPSKLHTAEFIYLISEYAGESLKELEICSITH